jgi:methylthioribose-1-phosphate isomerase
MRTVEWDYQTGNVCLIDQRMLPAEFKIVTLNDHLQVAEAIREMVVRGAPAIGATVAFGMALAAQNSVATSLPEFQIDLNAAAQALLAARPTAANSNWAITRILRVVGQSEGDITKLRTAILTEAQCIADEDVQLNRRMAEHGAVLIEDGDTIIHHCNTGALATVDWGTALGVIRMAHEQGKHVHVLVDETRPRLQGARLTAWELQRYGISYEIISDNAAGYFLQNGQVNKVFFGGDRMAANGDVANKIGTYMLALAAQDNHIPVYTVVPTSTIDMSLANGEMIPIEERSSEEVLGLQINGRPIAPKGAKARNPAFDVTPHRLLSAIVTEKGLIYPPFRENLLRITRG